MPKHLLGYQITIVKNFPHYIFSWNGYASPIPWKARQLKKVLNRMFPDKKEKKIPIIQKLRDIVAEESGARLPLLEAKNFVESWFYK